MHEAVFCALDEGGVRGGGGADKRHHAYLAISVPHLEKGKM